jgi:peptidoglycan/xylan/chitin deacetylase (PgdA/CDA1 family)
MERVHMYSRVRFYTSACFYYSGLVNLAHWWLQRSGPRLTILYYHQASKGNLRSHWLYLRRHYRILPLEEALEELQASSQGRNQSKDRRPLLALTFDDGYYDNYTHAFPLARELQLPITIFLIAGLTESGNAFWWVTRLVRLARVDQARFEERTYNLGQQEERKALALAIDRCFSQYNSPLERKEFVASLSTLLDLPSSVVLKEDPAPLLTWQQAQEMQESGWITFGAHTMYHPDLGSLADPAEVKREVGECRGILEQQLGHPVRSFAYPFGSIGPYVAEAAKEAGYDWAVTTKPGFNTYQSDPHLLKRRNMDGAKHWLVVAAETAGIWGIFSALKRNARLLLHKGSGAAAGKT